jgi:serine phosphatase RsbU (regulator of sigma subunit)
LHEEEVAAYVMNSVMEPPGREDGGLKAYVQPLNRFDGDVLLNDICGKGSFRLFLGDATGHGLAAAIAVIPAAQTFRAMNRKNLDCELLIRELNANIYRLFPRNIFLAATLIELAPRPDDGCDARIWNGGLDDLIVVREDGSLDRIRSRNLSLGILEPEGFEPQFENIVLAQGDRLYAYSDGLTESENSTGEGFGRARLEATLLAAPDPSARLEHVLTQQRAFVGNTALTDDLTLIEVQTEVIARRIRRTIDAASDVDLPRQALGSGVG